jgi:hypothetical protein
MSGYDTFSWDVGTKLNLGTRKMFCLLGIYIAMTKHIYTFHYLQVRISCARAGVCVFVCAHVRACMSVRNHKIFVHVYNPSYI